MSTGEALSQRQPLAARDNENGTCKAKNYANDMMNAQPFTRQESREHDQEKRPEIGDEAHLHSRRCPDGAEVKKVIAKQPGNAQEPYLPALPQG